MIFPPSHPLKFLIPFLLAAASALHNKGSVFAVLTYQVYTVRYNRCSARHVQLLCALRWMQTVHPLEGTGPSLPANFPPLASSSHLFPAESLSSCSVVIVCLCARVSVYNYSTVCTILSQKVLRSFTAVRICSLCMCWLVLLRWHCRCKGPILQFVLFIDLQKKAYTDSCKNAQF